jgi:virginiamycin B lyase
MRRFASLNTSVCMGLTVVVLSAGALTAERPAAQETSLDIAITEWPTPSDPPYPHDPAYNPADGSVWYTGQRANVIGRLDPSANTFREWSLPTADSGPHGLVPDSDGNIWYTGNAVGLIGKLDPTTGVTTEYKMPDTAARDPHTPVFGPDGMLYFTVQGGNFVGQLNPTTGEIRLTVSPTPNSRPYGIVAASTGRLYFAEFNSNKIGELDPTQNPLAIREFPLPDAGARPRRIAITSDDKIFYTDYARGILGRLDPESGDVSEYPSPGGESSQPYAIAVTPDDIVWYCETGVEPNTLVAFDPATEQVFSWNIPGGGGVVRHMVVGAENELWLAESGVGLIARVSITKN